MSQLLPPAAAPHIYVQSDSELASCCAQLARYPRIPFDSEFVRTDTFFPRAGLFQFAGADQVYLVDPLRVRDWDPLRRLLQGPDTTILIHSSSEDLSLLQHFLGVLPRRLFDTQRAAAFMGLDYSLSYQSLVRELTGIELPKGETRSDWLRRPLESSQIEYAVLDVIYLEEVYGKLVAGLRERNMLGWLEEDCLDLLAQVRDEDDEAEWETAYQAFGSAWQLNERQLDLLQKLCYWREARARERNKPRNWILKDPELLTLATSLPERPQGYRIADFQDSNGLSPRFLEKEGDRLVAFLAGPPQFLHRASKSALLRPLAPAGRQMLRSLQEAARGQAQRLGISPELLSRKKLLLQLLDNHYRGRADIWPEGLNNWRRGVLEEDFQHILGAGSGGPLADPG